MPVQLELEGILLGEMQNEYWLSSVARKGEILIFCKQTAVRFRVSYWGLLPKKLKFQLSWPMSSECHYFRSHLKNASNSGV